MWVGYRKVTKLGVLDTERSQLVWVGHRKGHNIECVGHRKGHNVECVGQKQGHNVCGLDTERVTMLN